MYYELLDRVTPPATPYDVEINNNTRKTFVIEMLVDSYCQLYTEFGLPVKQNDN